MEAPKIHLNLTYFSSAFVLNLKSENKKLSRAFCHRWSKGSKQRFKQKDLKLEPLKMTTVFQLKCPRVSQDIT